MGEGNSRKPVFGFWLLGGNEEEGYFAKVSEKDFPYLLKYKKEYFFGYSDNLGFTDRIYTEVPEEVEIFIGRNALLKYFEIENNCSIEDYYIGVKDN